MVEVEVVQGGEATKKAEEEEDLKGNNVDEDAVNPYTKSHPQSHKNNSAPAVLFMCKESTVDVVKKERSSGDGKDSLVEMPHLSDGRQSGGSSCTNLQDSSELLSIPLYSLGNFHRYENILNGLREKIEADPLANDLLLFPEDDIVLISRPKEIRSVFNSCPEEAYSDDISSHCRECIKTFNANWTILCHSYEKYSGNELLVQENIILSGGNRQEKFCTGLFQSSPVNDNVSLEKLEMFKNDEVSAHAVRVSNELSNTRFEVDFNDEIPSKTDTARSATDFSSNSPISSGSTVYTGVRRWSSQDAIKTEFLETIVEHSPNNSAKSLPSPNPKNSSGALKYEFLLNPDEERCSKVARISRNLNRFDLYSIYPDIYLKLTGSQNTSDSKYSTLFNPNRRPDVFREKFGKRIHVKFSELSFKLKQEEPFFCTACLYDCKEKVRVSEEFHFDLNCDEILNELNGQKKGERCFDCVFSVSDSHNEVFLVVHINKILQDKDIDEAAEPYIKDNVDTAKVEAKIRKSFQSCHQRLGSYQMPFALSIIPIFGEDGNIELNTDEPSMSPSVKKSSSMDLDAVNTPKSKSLKESSKNSSKGSLGSAFQKVKASVYRQEKSRLNDDDIFKFLSDMCKPNYTASRKFKHIPGSLTLYVEEVSGEGAFSNATDTFKPYVITWKTPSAIPIKSECCPKFTLQEPGNVVQEVQEFFPLSRPQKFPFVNYVNLMYIYPQALNFNNRSGIKCRNLAVKIEFCDTDFVCPDGQTKVIENRGLPVIFSPLGEPLLTCAYTSVSYHKKAPDYFDEIKICLPPKLTQKHHILFSFYHISCKEPKLKKNDESFDPKTLVGYSWLPLLGRNEQIMGDAHNLAVSTDLTNGYLRFTDSSDSNAPQNLKFVDGGRPLFKVHCNILSSIYPKDEYTNNFLYSCSRVAEKWASSGFSEFEMDETVFYSVKGLISALPSSLCQFLPCVLNTLLSLMCKKSSRLGQTTFQTLTAVVDAIHREFEDTEKNELLCTYVRNSFSNKNIASCVTYGETDVSSSGNLLVFEHMIDRFIGEMKQKTQSVELAVDHSWFYFEIMEKSIALYVDECASIRKVCRSERLSDDFVSKLFELSSLLLVEVRKRSKSSQNMAKKLNRNIGHFYTRLLGNLDRGLLFSLIEYYALNVSDTSDVVLLGMKLDFLSIVCNYEHYIPLNLPFLFDDEANLAFSVELCPEYVQNHYLAGLLLSEVSALFVHPQKNIRCEAIETLRNLLLKHECDARYMEYHQKERVFGLYFPLVGILVDMSSSYWRGNGTQEAKGLSSFGSGTSLSLEETRDLLLCFILLLKNSPKCLVRYWWNTQSQITVNKFLETLICSLSCFEYCGKAASRSDKSRSKPRGLKSLTYTKRFLEKAYTSIASKSKDDRNNSLRSARGSLRQPKSKNKADVKDDLDRSKMECYLSSEVAVCLLDAMDDFIVDFKETLDSGLHTCSIISKVLQFFLKFMRTNQSERSQGHCFELLRSFVKRFPDLIFMGNTEFCSNLCSCVLTYCNSNFETSRMLGSSLLYLLMKKNFEASGFENFARMKVQTTIALSEIVGAVNGKSRVHEECLKRSLSLICEFMSLDNCDFQNNDKFKDGVKEITSRLYTILRETVKIKSCSNDPMMLIDVQYRIARGYSNSPDLRLAWLQNMSQVHTKGENWAEAGMCVVHMAALVSEYQFLLEHKEGMPEGFSAFSTVSPNVKEESVTTQEIVSPDQEGICESEHFSLPGLVKLLELAILLLKNAKLYELTNELYKVLIRIYEACKDYPKLSRAHLDLSKVFDCIISSNHSQTRLLGSYFRIAFFGKRMKELNGREFIYKEPAITHLTEICSRLKEFYGAVLGPNNFSIIQDSGKINEENLDPEKGYAQVTFVKPYFEEYELKRRQSAFDKSTNLSRFVFETPYTASGKSHGKVNEQHKRVTVLSTEYAFPYVKTRLPVVSVETFDLTPLEVSIEAIKHKAEELKSATSGKPINKKMLQMVLQGCVSAQVNQGPLEIANVFLKSPGVMSYPHKQVKLLKACFKELVKHCGVALRVNDTLIENDQLEYQNDLRRKYACLKRGLEPLLSASSTSVSEQVADEVSK
eukprot:Nk52_evm69s485 gene=Nk52_evmTU69s485